MRRACLVVLTLAAARAAAAPRPITLDEALALARRHNLELRGGGVDVARADDEARSTRGALLPRLSLDDALQQWNERYAVDFGQGPPISVRDARTNSLTLSATQPVTGAFAADERWRAQRRLAGAARDDLRATRAEVELRVNEAYLRLLEAIDLEAIAEQAIHDIEEQARTTRALVDAGTLIEADWLRTQVALAQAQQDRLQAQVRVDAGRAALASLIGLPLSTELAPAPVDRSALPPLPASLDEALRGQRRPEVDAAGARAAAARLGSVATWIALLPQVSLVFAYQHYDGFGFVQPKNAAYLGGMLSWSFWDWGHNYYAARAASARADRAAVEVERRRRDVALEATRRYLDARAARATIDVAHSAVSQAEEAYRVARALYESGSSTTTELLDSQLALERARVNDARAVYDYLVARRALARALGETAAP